METITLSSTDNANHQTLHVAAGGLSDHHHHQHSPVDEDQMMNLSDMADLSQEMQESIVAIPKEVILISLVSQEQALYNPKHENYRNTQRKDMKWKEIADNVGWEDTQCKAKWKAMRDQYCRELKRSKFNAKANVKWKYFKELDFLRPYALARNYRPRNPIPANNNNNNTNSNNSTNSNNNNQNSYNCSAVATANDVNNATDNNNTKFTTIKIETNATESFVTCDFTSVKDGGGTNHLTEEQLNTVLQQQTDENNWTYITGSSTSSNNNSRLDNHSLGEATQHLLSTHHHHQQQHADEALYNALVDCVGQIQQQQQHQLCQQQSNSSQQNSSVNDEEDDDPIHTFLNIESYFEKELIALIQHEDVLYNSFNPNYRNVKLKLEVWDEIARKLKKTVKQCRLKWKALRDQFIREHKRLKNRENIESLPRWKHYDALSFLQKFIKHKAGEFEAKQPLMQITKTEIDADMDDDDDHMNISGSSPMRSPLDNIKREISHNHIRMPDLVSEDPNPNQNLHQHQHSETLCMATSSVGEYDDMDIDNYIIGDGDSVVDEHNAQEEQEDDTQPEDNTSIQEFSPFGNTTKHNGEEEVAARHPNLEATNASYKPSVSVSPQTLQTTNGGGGRGLVNEHQNQQTHHINMPSLDLSDNNDVISPDNNMKATTTTQTQQTYQASAASSNSPSLSLTTTLDMCAATPPPPAPAPASTTATQANSTTAAPSTSEAATNTQPTQLLPSNSNIASNNNSVNSEDDEVGAFFKAVAMKIRSAKLSPVAFTDLQIDILRVINGSLRNH
uniref:MADF domain-containing protein n=1 Tax=Stomoxys calcitrans TaxID=35570 RepID=A0A1I8NXE5_STOCA